MRKEIVLKSCNPVEYPDEVVSCKVIENADVNAYLATIPEERRTVATKVAPVKTRPGKVGEVVHTVLYTQRNGRKYILSEEKTTIGQRPVPQLDDAVCPDVVVVNVNSTSNEEYVVKANKFPNMYDYSSELDAWVPVPEEREFYQVDEDIIIKTAWGSEAVCLKGSHIVVYDASQNDFNTVEAGAKDSTYKNNKSKQKVNN